MTLALVILSHELRMKCYRPEGSSVDLRTSTPRSLIRKLLTLQSAHAFKEYLNCT